MMKKGGGKLNFTSVRSSYFYNAFPMGIYSLNLYQPIWEVFKMIHAL